jgi:hypothetical protein
MTAIDALLACPRCDKSLTPTDRGYRCDACKVDFDSISGIPFLFAEPEASLGEWRGRLNMALTEISHETSSLDEELKDKNLRSPARRRLERYRKALDYHRRALMKLLAPLDVQSAIGTYESYLALRTRLPVDQGLNTYYANVHRDWCWGDEENEASIKQIHSVARGKSKLGDTLVLGAGAGRLAYDIHMQFEGTTTTAFDFNPMLLLVAKEIVTGGRLSLHEFPIAPRSAEDDAVLRSLSAPAPVRDGFELVLGNALRPPFAAGSFDTIVTPWLIDIIDEELDVFAARINALLKDNGRWINFGSLAYATPNRASRLSPDEVKEIVAESGFSDPFVSETTIPYMCSPASRHGRQERVLTFSATRQRPAQKVKRHRALPDWIVTGKEAVPLSPSFRTQAMTTQIYSFMMSLIDGKRSIEDMADVMEKQRLMTRSEAVPAIRSFLTKMYDDAKRSTGF